MAERERTDAENAMREIVGAEAIVLLFATAVSVIFSLFGVI
jgi:hypothetical protein